MARKRRKPKKAKEPKKTGVSGERFRKSPEFKKSRQAAADFGQASQCAVLIRHELARVLELIRENDLHRSLSLRIGRLMGKTRSVNDTPVDPNHQPWEQMEGFQFNGRTSLGALIYAKPAVSFIPSTGKIDIICNSFGMQARLMKYKSATHARVIAGAAAMNFHKGKAVSDFTASDYIPIIRSIDENNKDGTIHLLLELPAPVIHPMFVVLGFMCYRHKDDEFEMMGDLKYKALEIIHVSPAPKPAAGKRK